LKDVKVILNPIAGRGYAARVEPELRQMLAHEGVSFELERTQHAGHAVELATRAAQEGYNVIVAAGGDGTSNEVVAGLMAAAGDGVAGTMGVIPVGSGSDFAHNVGVPADLNAACHRLAHGQDRIVDVGVVQVDDQPPRFFDNTVNIGFGGTVTVEAQKVKWVRGMALYLPVVLKTIFLTHAPRIAIEMNGHRAELPAAMICVANGAREGGGFFSAPDAVPDDGLLDVCVVHEMGNLAMLRLVPKFMNGTHKHHPLVTMTRTDRVTVSSPDDLVAHADGEVLCTAAHRLSFELLPQRLRVRC
jgi:diacylglycerol kinase (ATP)